jgi:outer membrane protein assembly factor BamB
MTYRLVLALLSLNAATVAAGDWPCWRGPGGQNHAEPAQNLPATFSATEHVLWKSPVPGRGHSSPIVVGNQIFLTTADEQRQVQSVLAFDRNTGKERWQTVVNTGGFPGQIHSHNTHATPTLACDGERLFALFNNHGHAQLTALALDGRILWQIVAGDFEPERYKFGFAPSPLLFGPLVIVASEFEHGFLAAFDRISGKEAWRVSREGIISFSSPIIARAAGREQLLLSGGDHLRSFNPLTGVLLWQAPGCSKATCGTAVWEAGLAFASGGFPEHETICTKADGSGEVLWHNGENCYEQSLLAHAGYVYAVDNDSIAFCWRASDGKEMWKHRLGGKVSASPVLADGRIYQINERGTLYVLRESAEKYDLLLKTQFGDEAFATPAICGGRMYLRVADRSASERQEFLYCIGQ